MRIRPLNQLEHGTRAQYCLSTYDAASISIGKRAFTYDAVFETASTQHEVFAHSVEPLVDKFVTGFNATVLAYGQTGSGKTHTILGPDFLSSVGSVDEASGLVSRIVDQVFQTIAARPDDLNKPGGVELSVTFLELYCESFHDLFTGLMSQQGAASSRPAILLRETSDGEIRVDNAQRFRVTTPVQLRQLLAAGLASRATAATDLNAASSRSHAIVTLYLRQVCGVQARLHATASPSAAHGRGSHHFEAAHRRLGGYVPLSAMQARAKAVWGVHIVVVTCAAGSERLKRSGVAGQQLKEAVHINSGLSALGKVISALSDQAAGRNNIRHIPYRDSKLTRLLQVRVRRPSALPTPSWRTGSRCIWYLGV